MIEILDCTLRDGSHVNEGKFSKGEFSLIFNALNKVAVDYVEVGFLEPGHPSNALSYFNSLSEMSKIVDEFGYSGQKYGFLLRTDRCEIDAIKKSEKLAFCRIAMYPEHEDEVRKYAKEIIDNDYKLFINPIGITTLTRNQIVRIIEVCNDIGVDALSIVDTNGALDKKIFLNTLKIFESRLDPSCAIGIHLHENLNRCQLLVECLLENKSRDRNYIIDASLNGMGRIPGNLPLELLLLLLKDYRNKENDVRDLYGVIQQLRDKYFNMSRWGYNIIYAESARLNINRSYPEFFESQGMDTSEIVKYLSVVNKTEKKFRFDKHFASKLIK